MESWGFAPAALTLLALTCYGFGRALLSLAATAARILRRIPSAGVDSDVRPPGALSGEASSAGTVAHKGGSALVRDAAVASVCEHAAAAGDDEWFISSRRPDWAMALGATVVGALIVLLGLIGLLDAAGLWAMTLAGGLTATAYLLVFDRLGDAARSAVSAADVRWKPLASRLAATPLFGPVAVSGGIVVLVLLLISQAPPTSDDVVPPLESAQRWLLQSPIAVLADDDCPGRNDAVVLLPQAWLAWALALGGPEAARGVGVLWALALAAAAARWAGATLGRHAALPAGCLTLLAPGVIGGALSLSPALPAVALTLLAFDGIGRLGRKRSSRPGPAAVMCGIMLGGALHAVALPAVLLAVLWEAARASDATSGPLASDQGGKPARRTGATWAAAAALTLSAAVHSLALAAGGTIDFSLAQSTASAFAANAPASPWGGPSIAVVLLLPMALGLAQPASLRPMKIALPAYLLLTGPTITQPETYLPLIVVLALPALHALNRVGQMSAMPRRIVAGAATVGMLATAAAVLWHWAPAAAAACGGGREEYLLCRQPHWSIAAAADRMLPADAHLLTPTESAFYFRRQTISYAALLRRASEQDIRWDHRLLAAQLRSAGLTHALTVRFSEPRSDDLSPAIARLNGLVLQAAEGPNPWPCALDVASPDRQIRYQIWRIPD